MAARAATVLPRARQSGEPLCRQAGQAHQCREIADEIAWLHVGDEAQYSACREHEPEAAEQCRAPAAEKRKRHGQEQDAAFERQGAQPLTDGRCLRHHLLDRLEICGELDAERPQDGQEEYDGKQAGARAPNDTRRRVMPGGLNSSVQTTIAASEMASWLRVNATATTARAVAPS